MARRRPTATTGPRAVDRADPLPLWAQLHADLTRRLDVGEFGEVFPSESALVAEYEVSRQTVREALRRLRETGLVSSGPGRSSRVVPETEIEQPLGVLYSLFESVEAAGRRPSSVVRALDVRRDGVVARRLGLEESTPLVHLERLRLADGEPLAMDRVWLPAELASGLLDADLATTALYDQLARRCGVRLTGGREHIVAVIPTETERALLALPAGVAAFAVDRLGCVNSRPVEWRHTLIRADRFSVTSDFSTRLGYRLDVATTGRAGR